ncbi:hypothetical protein KY308_02260 [Candidatus Woesearchaeota archaeon]|nr:hypothetical protein [Candidatus Woesearchaeota archaeon]
MLYDVLKNRASVNILKILYDNELANKNSYSLKKSHIQAVIKDDLALDSALITLGYEGLILKEEVEGELFISITEKGKQFIAIFDQLILLLSSKAEEARQQVEIKYELTDAEKKLLLTLYKLQKETGKEISLSDLSRELYPYEDSEKKKSKVSSLLSRLQEMNLVEKIKKERKTYSSITESGEKVAQRHILNVAR